MARIPRTDLVHMAIIGGVLGYIQWKPSAVENMLKHPRMMSWSTPQGVRNELRAWVRKNGVSCITPRPETDQDWLAAHPDDPWWYQVVIDVDEIPEGLFVKMKLVDPDDDVDPFVEIVGAHPSSR